MNRMDNAEERSTRRRRKGRRFRWGRFFLFFLGALVFGVSFIAGGVYAYYNFFPQPVKLAEKQEQKVPQTDEKLAQMTNILLLGEDDGDYGNIYEVTKRSDTMMLVSINPINSKVNLLSIPRDTRVEIPGRSGADKIGHAYAYGGPFLAEKTVSQLLQVPINYYVAVDWQGFIKAIDVLGGVSLYVEKNLDYDDPYANLSIHLKQGYQHLDGQAAGGYVRFRHDELADVGRMQRQQKFLKSLGDEIFQPSTLLKVPSLMQTVKQYVKTDMDVLTMLKVVNSIKGVALSKNLETKVLPGRGVMINNVSYWQVDEEKAQALLDAWAAGLETPGSEPKKQ